MCATKIDDIAYCIITPRMKAVAKQNGFFAVMQEEKEEEEEKKEQQTNKNNEEDQEKFYEG